MPGIVAGKAMTIPPVDALPASCVFDGAKGIARLPSFQMLELVFVLSNPCM